MRDRVGRRGPPVVREVHMEPELLELPVVLELLELLESP